MELQLNIPSYMITNFRTHRTCSWAQYSTKPLTSRPTRVRVYPFTPNSAYTDPTFADCVSNDCAKTWGLRIINCTNVFQYGAGLYSFFENWSSANCLAAENCQQHMVDIQNSNDIYLWALRTVGTSYLISYDRTDLVPYSVNKANFADTIALFEIAFADP